MAKDDAVIILHKRKGLKQLIKKLVWLQYYNASCGINRKDNRKHGKYSLVKIADWMESGITYLQKTTKFFRDRTGKIFASIPEGTSVTIPPRPFIDLSKHDNVFGTLREHVRVIIKMFITPMYKADKNYCKEVITRVGVIASNMQKNIIGSTDITANGKLTEKIKGFNSPLFDTGMLKNAISSVIGKNSAIPFKDTKVKYCSQIDEIISDINKYMGKKK